MNTVPRLSIGLPVYNGEEFLAESLDALLGQTFHDFELIITDNASTDATEQVARDYVAQDSRVRYLRLDRNIGAAQPQPRVHPGQGRTVQVGLARRPVRAGAAGPVRA